MPFAHCRNLKKDCSVNPHPQPFSQWEKGERLKSVTDRSQACDSAIQASHPHPTSPKGRGDVRKPDTSLQSRRIYQRRLSQRSDLNAARSSVVKISGCSQAAKCPPFSTLL